MPGVRSRSSMSSCASGTPNRAARARALGRSMSHSATTSTDLSFLSVGKWATCAMAPPPTIPTLSRSLVLRLAVMRFPPSIETLQHRAGVVRAEDALVILTGPRAPHGTPLTHADSVARARAVGREASDLAAGAGHGERKGIAAQHLARDGSKHLPHARLVHQHIPAAEAHRELAHPAGRRAVGDPHVPYLAHVHGHRRGPAAGRQARQSPLQRGPEGLAGPLLVPAESRRETAVGRAVIRQV